MSPPAVAIVGAGILGCMIANEIATRTPGLTSTLLDQDMAGSGATRRSAGLHVPSGGTDRVRRMAGYSQEYYEKLRRNDPALPIHPLGMTVVAAETSAPHLRDVHLAEAALTRTDRVPHPAVVVPPGSGVWTADGCQYADVYALTQAIVRGLRPHTDVREGVRVTGVESGRDGVTLTLGTGETLTVDRVVLAPGPWLDADVWRTLAAPLGIRMKKIVALHIERQPHEDDHAIVFPDEDAFLLPLAHRGHWLFSYTCNEWDVGPEAPVDGLSTEHLAEAHGCLRRYAPALVEHSTSGRVFCDAYSPDREPVVRALDDAGRIVFAGAASGSGYRLAPAIASEAADLLNLSSKVWSQS